MIKEGNGAGIFFTWIIGNGIVTILIVPACLRYVTPKIRKSKLMVKYYGE
jgi:hypothetical protein